MLEGLRIVTKEISQILEMSVKEPYVYDVLVLIIFHMQELGSAYYILLFLYSLKNYPHFTDRSPDLRCVCVFFNAGLLKIILLK